MPTNDNEFDKPGLIAHTADAHGQAALLLVEALIHALVERSVLTTVEAVDLIEGAIEVQAEFAEAADGAGAKMWQSHALLSAMSVSLQHDLSGPDSPPS